MKNLILFSVILLSSLTAKAEPCAEAVEKILKLESAKSLEVRKLKVLDLFEQKKYAEISQVLKSRTRDKVSPEIWEEAEFSPLMMAAQVGDLKMVEALVKYSRQTNEYIHGVHYSLTLNNGTTIFLNDGSPKFGVKWGDNALSLAVRAENIEVVDFLLKKTKINPNTMGYGVELAFEASKNPEMFRMLINHPRFDLLLDNGDRSVVETKSITKVLAWKKEVTISFSPITTQIKYYVAKPTRVKIAKILIDLVRTGKDVGLDEKASIQFWNELVSLGLKEEALALIKEGYINQRSTEAIFISLVQRNDKKMANIFFDLAFSSQSRNQQNFSGHESLLGRKGLNFWIDFTNLFPSKEKIAILLERNQLPESALLEIYQYYLSHQHFDYLTNFERVVLVARQLFGSNPSRLSSRFLSEINEREIRAAIVAAEILPPNTKVSGKFLTDIIGYQIRDQRQVNVSIATTLLKKGCLDPNEVIENVFMIGYTGIRIKMPLKEVFPYLKTMTDHPFYTSYFDQMTTLINQ
jgi:hypothetical protein